MAKYLLKIELLSDMCASDGGVYNSMIDTDICYDELGFPFIPAKRIKGCLRECALELKDWGYKNPVTKEALCEEALFGAPGREKDIDNKRAKVRFANAYPENYDSMKKEILASDGNGLYHQQLVLNQFSYIRTQTAISQETGIADETSLRTMRVINKGTNFIAEIEMPEEYYEDLKACCEILEHMGIARTRGFGEVLVNLTSYSEIERSLEHCVLTPEADYLAYEINIDEPVICRSIAGGESCTQDYIEGSKILGTVLSGIRSRKGENEVKAFLSDELLCFSNAYVGVDCKRFTEIPSYVYGIKNNKKDYVNRILHKQNITGLQLSQMKHCYSLFEGEDLYTINVKVEERYHHRRSDNKAIGRATTKEGNSDFYQISSISAGQKFYGYITGSSDMIAKAYDAFTAFGHHYIGYARSAEYGKTTIRVINTGKMDVNSLTLDKVLVKLEAPVIVYNEKAMYSVDKNDLIKEICRELNINEKVISKKEEYINYTTIGGFNVTWGLRKPTIGAFDKGSVICLTLNKAINVPRCAFIGERNLEGFGEISISPLSSKVEDETLNLPDLETSDYLENARMLIRSGEIHSIENDRNENLLINIKHGSLGDGIARQLYTSYLRAKAIKSVENKTVSTKMRPTISNMLVDFSSYKSIANVQEMVDKRYGKESEKKEDKLKYAQKILAECNQEFEKSKQEFCEKYGIADWEWNKGKDDIDTSKYQLLYLREVLISMKYRIRETTKEGR